jgi:hypothetical protein
MGITDRYQAGNAAQADEALTLVSARKDFDISF